MKQFFTTIAILGSLSAFAQTAEEHFQNGIKKHTDKDYAGAIKDYSKAIKANKDYADAYFNRGSCELGLKDLKAAKADFDKTIELNPKFAKAYYSRATVFLGLDKYAESLPDLDKVIELDPSTPNAFTLRGQIRAKNDNMKGACEDFNKAKEMGDPKADQYLTKFCSKEQPAGESLMLDWPDSERWKVGSNQVKGHTTMIELIHSDETFENWTEFGSMMSAEGIRNVPMDKAMNLMFDQAKQNSRKAKLTFIEKDESAEYPWILFTIESPGFKNDKNPESQLYYIVQGKTTLYTNFRAVKQATISADLKEKWIKFFKTGKVVTK